MKLNVGLIGKGKWGKIIKKKLNILSNLKFTCGKNKDYLRLIKSSNVKWVFIVTPNNTHYKLVKMCLNNGVNVFCEKPLCISIHQAKKLISISKKNKVKLFVSDLYNFYSNKLENINSVTEIYRSKLVKGLDKEFFYRFMYHDISILYKKLKKLSNFTCQSYHNNFEKKFKLVIDTSNKKRFTFFYNLKSKKKEHLINNACIKLKKDILKEMINNVLKNKVKFDQNNQKALFIIKFINQIKKKVKKVKYVD
jgi:hypothetical protein